MIPIQDLLHRIRWDRNFGDAVFEVGYLDRVQGRIVRVPFRDVRIAQAAGPVLEVAGEDGVFRTVPLHRVREVWRDGVSIWARASG